LLLLTICTEGGTKKKKKGSAYQTISATHRVIIYDVTFYCMISIKKKLYIVQHIRNLNNVSDNL